jgi:hypothetical protein
MFLLCTLYAIAHGETAMECYENMGYRLEAKQRDEVYLIPFEVIYLILFYSGICQLI